MIRVLIIIFMILSFGCCSKESSNSLKQRLTQQQRDSVLSESKLPGAKVVGKAISVADSAAARKNRLDEQTK
jgi:hypothetical protein